MSELTPILCAEHELTARQQEDLQKLLAASFPGYFTTRSYFKQLPHLRMLGYEGDRLVGQIGIDHRMIRVGSTPVEIFGPIDVCVDPERRARGHASALLREIERVAARHHVDVLLLFADDGRLYERNGYVHLERPVHWLGIHEHETVGLLDRMDDCIYVKALAAPPFPDGAIDLLGYLF